MSCCKEIEGCCSEPEPELLKKTTSRCPECLASCPGEVWKTADSPSRVILTRYCPEHGEATTCIASDSRFYWLSVGKDENACCGGGVACRASDNEPAGTLGKNAEPGDALGIQESLSTCLALIEIVNSCNLKCPTCFAA